MFPSAHVNVVTVSRDRNVYAVNMTRTGTLTSLSNGVRETRRGVRIVERLVFRTTISRLRIREIYHVLGVRRIRRVERLQNYLRRRLRSLHIVLCPMTRSNGKGNGGRHISCSNYVCLSSLVNGLLTNECSSRFNLYAPITVLDVLVPYSEQGRAVHVLHVLACVAITSVLHTFVLHRQ